MIKIKTERKFTFTIILENEEFDLFKHIWIEAVDIERFGLEPHQDKIKQKHIAFHEKITKELI